MLVCLYNAWKGHLLLVSTFTCVWVKWSALVWPLSVCYLTHGEVWELRATHSCSLMSTNWPNTFPYQIVFESKTFSSPFRFMFVELKQKQKNDLRAKSLHFKHNPIQINERIQFIPLKIVIYFCVRLCWSLINERLNELILFPWPRPLHRWRLTRGHARLAGLLAPPHRDLWRPGRDNGRQSGTQPASSKTCEGSWSLFRLGLPLIASVSWRTYCLRC